MCWSGGWCTLFPDGLAAYCKQIKKPGTPEYAGHHLFKTNKDRTIKEELESLNAGGGKRHRTSKETRDEMKQKATVMFQQLQQEGHDDYEAE